MRENLKPMLGKVITVEGTFITVTKKAGGKRLVLFKNITLLNTDKVIADHIWISATKETMKYESGERVIFCAEVYKYKKKADIQGFDILVDSYGLTKIRNIRRIEEYGKKLQDAI